MAAAASLKLWLLLSVQVLFVVVLVAVLVVGVGVILYIPFHATRMRKASSAGQQLGCMETGDRN